MGKTDLSLELAAHYSTVILSADSRQFYREMNIGTAKPNTGQLSRVKHYFINNKSINDLYSAGNFEKDALDLLDRLFMEHPLIFITGGSGLYLNAVLKGVDNFIEVPDEVRNKLNKEFKESGINYLQNKLKELDEPYFNSVDLNNPQRIIRALEVCIHTGKPYSSFINKPKVERKFIPIQILINCEREELYKKINQRTDKMMAEGLLDEVKQLMPFKHFNALKTVGYKELFAYLDGSYDLVNAVIKIKQHTRNYAKRQLTWFKNQNEFEEFNPHDFEKIKAYIDIIIANG